jgi:hypothetical protein
MSKVEVNQISSQCGSTLTIGQSGDTVQLASGATQTGFGRTGTVDWQTTPKTANFTAANGEGYFVNTTSSAITMTMPSGSAGAIVSIQDYNKTFDTNNLTVTPASGEKINGGTADGDLTLNSEGQGLTFVYVDSTVGWKTIHDNNYIISGTDFISATGGTETTSGNYKIHTFTGPGTFTVNAISPTAANNTVSYLVVAGGGSGGSAEGGGGGGAGGAREYKGPADCYTASPLNGNPGGTAITVTAQSYPITIGAGGSTHPGTPANGNPGSNSIFSTVTSTGGGSGAEFRVSNDPNAAGGSGGGASGRQTSSSPSTNEGGAGNTPPVSPSQGNNGGRAQGPAPASGNDSGGGGGGATATGSNGGGGPTGYCGGAGGAGATTCISGSPVAYAGGGGGGVQSPGNNGGSGGTGGGGAGFTGPSGGATGTTNRGGGGGGAGASGTNGQAGGSGIVIIRYKFQ